MGLKIQSLPFIKKKSVPIIAEMSSKPISLFLKSNLKNSQFWNKMDHIWFQIEMDHMEIKHKFKNSF